MTVMDRSPRIGREPARLESGLRARFHGLCQRRLWFRWHRTAIACVVLAAALLQAEEPVEPIAGVVVLAGGGALPEEARESFWHAAGGKAARIVEFAAADDGEQVRRRASTWRGRDVDRVDWLAVNTVRPAGNPAEATRDDVVELLANATGVWLGDAAIGDYLAAFDDMRRTALAKVVARGRIVYGEGRGAAVLGERWVTATGDHGRGFGLLPRSAVGAGALAEGRPALASELRARPGRVGYWFEPGALVVLQGRTLRVISEATVTVGLAASRTRPARWDTYQQRGLIDMMAMVRAAEARTAPAFPPANVTSAGTDRGTLVIVGGGLTRDIITAFIDAAGGVDEARIVVIPTAMGEPAASRGRHGGFLEQAGVQDVRIVHARSRREAERPQHLEALQRATGIWFTGGRQWRLVDAYAGTEAEKRMHGVLARGGVIGGSSAGATIQGEYLVRGNPLGNWEMMSEGYERGLGFLRGVAIDQHFTQRNRFADMRTLKRVFPQLLGLGIDERTAVVVTKDLLEVVGDHRVTIYDGRAKNPEAMLSLESGELYDLRRWSRVKKL